MTRREERELAFAIGFERCVAGAGTEEIIEGAEMARDIVVPDFAMELAHGVEENEAELDAIISKCIRGWDIGRLSKVAFAIMRLAIYEVIHESGIPVSVSINEAVELAKKYGDAEDAPFVNGVLSTVAKEFPKPEEV